MCGGKREEEEDLADDMDEEKACAKPARVFLFILNFIIWLGSCGLLALGIYALVDTSFAADVLDGPQVLSAAVLLIIVGGAGFLISFIGCCGAYLKNKCLILTYVIVLILLLAILLIGGILGVMFTTRLQVAAVEAMKKSMMNYDINNKAKKTNVAWDTMQRSFKCCGIMNQNDWKTNDGFKSTIEFPESCCVIDSTTNQVSNGCTSGNTANMYYKDIGCHDKLIKFLDKHSPYIAIVGAVVALCMILGVIFGIVVRSRLP